MPLLEWNSIRVPYKECILAWKTLFLSPYFIKVYCGFWHFQLGDSFKLRDQENCFDHWLWKRQPGHHITNLLTLNPNRERLRFKWQTDNLCMIKFVYYQRNPSHFQKSSGDYVMGSGMFFPYINCMSSKFPQTRIIFNVNVILLQNALSFQCSFNH